MNKWEFFYIISLRTLAYITFSLMVFYYLTMNICIAMYIYTKYALYLVVLVHMCIQQISNDRNPSYLRILRLCYSNNLSELFRQASLLHTPRTLRAIILMRVTRQQRSSAVWTAHHQVTVNVQFRGLLLASTTLHVFLT